jgi:hypothetical protein
MESMVAVSTARRYSTKVVFIGLLDAFARYRLFKPHTISLNLLLILRYHKSIHLSAMG